MCSPGQRHPSDNVSSSLTSQAHVLSRRYFQQLDTKVSVSKDYPPSWPCRSRCGCRWCRTWGRLFQGMRRLVVLVTWGLIAPHRRSLHCALGPGATSLNLWWLLLLGMVLLPMPITLVLVLLTAHFYHIEFSIMATAVGVVRGILTLVFA